MTSPPGSKSQVHRGHNRQQKAHPVPSETFQRGTCAARSCCCQLDNSGRQRTRPCIGCPPCLPRCRIGQHRMASELWRPPHRTWRLCNSRTQSLRRWAGTCRLSEHASNRACWNLVASHVAGSKRWRCARTRRAHLEAGHSSDTSCRALRALSTTASGGLSDGAIGASVSAELARLARGAVAA